MKWLAILLLPSLAWADGFILRGTPVPAAGGGGCVQADAFAAGTAKDVNVGFNAATAYKAQEWIPTVTETLTQIDIHIKAMSSTAAGYTWYAEIRDNNSTHPTSGTYLGQATFTDLTSGSYVTKTIQFSPGISLTASTHYWLVVHRGGLYDATHFINLQTREDGSLRQDGSADGSTWSNNFVTDLVYMTWYYGTCP